MTATRSRRGCWSMLWTLLVLSTGFCESYVPLVVRGAISRRSWTRSARKSATEETLAASANATERVVEFKMHQSIAEITPEAWNSCLTASSSPFLEHDWLRCLEESKCASPSTGWVPQHLSIAINGQIQGFVPLYIKGHSMGEFIFDQQFAEAAYQNGIEYYPKLLVGIPFTPATGQRILWHPRVLSGYSRSELKQLRRAVGTFLKQLAVDNQLSSVHCNFLTDEEAEDLAGPLTRAVDREKSIADQVQSMLGRLTVKNDYLRRTSLQYHWLNRNPMKKGRPFTDFDDYLGCFKSKRRISVRRERSKVRDEEQIVVDAIVGKEILQHKGLVRRMFEIYLSTIDKMIWGRQYLTLEFFELLVKSNFVDHLCFMCARRKSSDRTFAAEDVFAGTINIIKDGVFYGRYWGCLHGREVKNLHFEACYWSAIEYCIANGLERMEPGAGGGDYKFARGFDPALIHSVHYICHPDLRRAVGQFLDYETDNNVELTEYLSERSAVGSKARQST